MNNYTAMLLSHKVVHVSWPRVYYRYSCYSGTTRYRPHNSSHSELQPSHLGSVRVPEPIHLRIYAFLPPFGIFFRRSSDVPIGPTLNNRSRLSWLLCCCKHSTLDGSIRSFESCLITRWRKKIYPTQDIWAIVELHRLTSLVFNPRLWNVAFTQNRTTFHHCHSAPEARRWCLRAPFRETTWSGRPVAWSCVPTGKYIRVPLRHGWFRAYARLRPAYRDMSGRARRPQCNYYLWSSEDFVIAKLCLW